jgi:gamma-butyrobetaine dioxygenase
MSAGPDRLLTDTTAETDAARESIDELLALYASPGALRMYDEVVTELEHALQAAALARADGAPDHLIAAALLHDAGHLIADDNVTLDDELTEDFHHERVGARHLTRWFGPEVTAPVALHVAAKRYLCAVEEHYLADLSPSSLRSLGLQGGPMSPAEVEAFERLPHHAEAVLVRRWDDRAKVDGLAVADLSDYRSLLAGLVTGASTSSPSRETG